MVPSPPWLHSKHGKCPCPDGGEGAAPPPSHAAVSSIQSPQAVPLWVPQPCSLLPLGLRQLQSAATFYRWDFAGVGGRGGAFLELCLHFWSFLRDTFSRQPPPPQQPVGLQLFQNTVPISLPCWAAPRAKSMCWGVSTALPAVPRCQCQTVRPHISPPAPPHQSDSVHRSGPPEPQEHLSCRRLQKLGCWGSPGLPVHSSALASSPTFLFSSLFFWEWGEEGGGRTTFVSLGVG